VIAAMLSLVTAVINEGTPSKQRNPDNGSDADSMDEDEEGRETEVDGLVIDVELDLKNFSMLGTVFLLVLRTGFAFLLV
jgi:hypothetical protein